MSFLTPWFLAGLVLVAGPIVAHLIRRATKERVAFSALRFLDTSAPRLDRRSRVQHPWLLLLRCLIVAVLAFGFARPFLRDNAPPTVASTQPRHVVVVLDESASMQRQGAWDSARARVQLIVDDLSPADRLVLLAAGDRVSEILGADQWTATIPESRAALVRDILADRQPGWGPTPLDSAAESALAQWEEMAESGDTATQRELIFVSDFASGSRTAGLANLDWPANARVVLKTITPSLLGNASLHWLGWSEQDPAKPAARIRLSRTFDAPENLRLQWRDASSDVPLSEPEQVTLLPGANEIRLIPLPENPPSTLTLTLEGDEQPFDNRLWLVRSPSRELPIVTFSDHASDDPSRARFYLERAIAGWREPVARLAPTAPAAGPALYFVDAPLNSSRIADLRSRLEAGAFALVLLADEAVVATAGELAGESNWTPASTEREDALLGSLDFQHPLFAPFADPLFSDFTRVRFWQPHTVSLPADTRAEVVARFDDDSPAVLEIAVGQGRLIVWPGDWTPAASQWVLSSKFVPWLQALAERAAGGAAQPAVVEIGSATAQALLPGTSQAGSVAPGIHESTTIPPRLIAVNVPAAESRTEPLPLDTWEQLGVPLRKSPSESAAAQVASSQQTSTEAQQQLWRWLLWLAVALLALESLASFALSRAGSTPFAPSP